jgi:hypothetical protein
VTARALPALAEAVIQAVNEARAAKADEHIGAELQSTLRELDGTRSKLVDLADVIPELPLERDVVIPLAETGSRLRTLLSSAEVDAVSAARSDEGRLLTADLRSRVSELGDSATEAWSELRVRLRPEAGTDFLQRLGGLPGFGVARTLLRDHYTVEQARLSARLPDGTTVREAKAARRRFDEGLAQLQEELPEAVRKPLERCFRDELRLVDVTDDFLQWIRDNNLDDAFTVSAS